MSERIYAYATFQHYMDHLMPTVEALRDLGHDVDVLSSSKKSLYGEYVHPAKLDPRGLWMVAGSVDVDKMQNRRYVYFEHGAGQTYEADERGLTHRSYSTGRFDPPPLLFVCPNEFVASRRRRTHPEAQVVVAGASHLDHLHAYASGWHEGVEGNVVAITFHWDCPLVPETQSAWEHYRPHLMRQVVLPLHRRGFKIVGHAHPRIAKRARYHMERMGMEWWDHEEVLTRAALLCFDNTSMGYEFASLDRPVVVMNAPWYRRDVHHGLRFWECVPGVMVDDASQLVDAIEVALGDDDPALRDCVKRIYPLRDGLAAERSARAIESLLLTPTLAP